MTDTGDQREDIHLDLNDRDFIDHRHERYAEVRARCPVVFDTAAGGFWLVTDYDSVATIARDNETFLHTFDLAAPDGIAYEGICGYPRHPEQPAQGVSEIDGPDHQDLRRALNARFSPAGVLALRPDLERVTTWFLDEVIEHGEMDLVLDFTSPVPAVLTLMQMGIPCEHWKRYADFFHTTAAHAAEDPEYQSVMSHVPEMMAEFAEFAAYRRTHPGDDIVTMLVNLERESGPLTDQQVVDVIFNLVAGGIDTTTSLVSWALHHLGTDLDARRRLIADRSLLGPAIEEYLRFYSPNETLTRTAARDVELGGRQISRGDRIWISWVAANRDPAVFERPDEVLIDRANNRHLAFGLGGHRCIGMHLARAEAAAMIDEVLRRIPDYVVDPERFLPYPGGPMMTGISSMPVSFAPGSRSGPTERPF
ncbi:MAG: cytochrome P450 [Actinomycetes bacterium]